MTPRPVPAFFDLVLQHPDGPVRDTVTIEIGPPPAPAAEDALFDHIAATLRACASEHAAFTQITASMESTPFQGLDPAPGRITVYGRVGAQERGDALASVQIEPGDYPLDGIVPEILQDLADAFADPLTRTEPQ